VHARGYYGHIRHNVKAIYQKYLGWYDANPVNLDPLPPVEAGKKFVEYMGGADAILERATKDFAKGEFRFVAQASAIWYSPSPTISPPARCSRILSSNSAMPPKARPGATPICLARRNCGRACRRRRRGRRCRAKRWPPCAPNNYGTCSAFASMAEGEGKHIVLNWSFTDTGETFVLTLENAR